MGETSGVWCEAKRQPCAWGGWVGFVAPGPLFIVTFVCDYRSSGRTREGDERRHTQTDGDTQIDGATQIDGETQTATDTGG